MARRVSQSRRIPEYREFSNRFAPRLEMEDVRLLIDAVRSVDRMTVQSLLQGSMDPNAQDSDGTTAVHVAAESRDTEWILQELLKAGGNPNAKSFTAARRTPVHLACLNDRVDNLRILLEYGGNIDVVSQEGMNALDYARKYDARGTLTLLKGFAGNRGASDAEIWRSRNKSEERRHRVSYDNHSAPLKNYHVSPIKSRIFHSPTREDVLDDSDSDYYSPPTTRKVTRKSPLRNAGSRAFARSSSLTRYGSDYCSEDSEKENDLPITRKRVQFPSLRNKISPTKEKIWASAENLSRLPARGLEPASDVSVDMYCDTLTARRNQQVPDLSTYARFTDHEIRHQLKQLGAVPGAIRTSSERLSYIKQLINLKQVSPSKQQGNGSVLSKLCDAKQKFCQELDQFIEERYDKRELKELEVEFEQHFDMAANKWFQGNHYFVYVLLDPRISNNIPHQIKEEKNVDLSLKFRMFLRSVFYVGKGKDARMIQHLKDAKRLYDSNNLTSSEKIARIFSIWDADHGIVNLMCFHSRTDQEAHTREALMILALGKDKLANSRHGTLYGPAKRWTDYQKRLVGSLYLYKSFQILLNQGEKQVFPHNISP